MQYNIGDEVVVVFPTNIDPDKSAWGFLSGKRGKVTRKADGGGGLYHVHFKGEDKEWDMPINNLWLFPAVKILELQIAEDKIIL
jgi:hypothetical protein